MIGRATRSQPGGSWRGSAWTEMASEKIESLSEKETNRSREREKKKGSGYLPGGEEAWESGERHERATGNHTDNEAREREGELLWGYRSSTGGQCGGNTPTVGRLRELKRFLVEDLSSQSKNFRAFRLFAFLASDLLTVVRLGIIAKATPCLLVQRYHFLSCSAVNATVGFMALAPPNSSSAVFGSGTYRDVLYPELWKACAGPLVTLPCEGERVYYFPQGHMEQNFPTGLDLPSKIPCKVVHVQLRLKQIQMKFLLRSCCCLKLIGENDELLVTVIRLMRPINSMPSSVISSHSMHVGVLATAFHAITTGTLFSVFNKPRSTQESQNQQLRSCTKVHMQGMTVGFGRAVSLTILYGYNDLFLKLEEMFNIKGELFGKVKKWEVVYTDEEEDTMMVSDDPCQLVPKVKLPAFGEEIKPTSKISFPNADTKHTKLEDQISTLNKITDHLLATKPVHELFFRVRLAAGSAYRVQKVVLFVLWPLTDSPAVLLT
ncbi:hypothetical protein ZIOFF_033425 [Zingiber officinale]|uniref:PB1 domain-containing protein n=1 Tax=Zingiber officinale TaxID=94328 RepID=A0A8J5GQB6_ZINOF|nr:hypothetical protein ZIOFF_033425 [Zingiber officinale]